MQWITLVRKEMLELWENKKWIWVPLVFALMMLMDPITYYYLPEIMELAGGVPEGAIFEVPDMTAEQVLMMSVDQLNLFGVLVVILITMGTITREIQSGVTEMILVKPIRYSNYVTSKWLVYSVLTLLSLVFGSLISVYYVVILYGALPIKATVLAFIVYSIWLFFIVSITIFYNTIVKSSGVVFALTAATLILLSIVRTVFGHQLTMLPNQLAPQIGEMLMSNTVDSTMIYTALITVGLSIGVIYGSIYLFQRKEHI